MVISRTWFNKMATVIIAAMLIFAGCDENSTNPETEGPPSEIVGTWLVNNIMFYVYHYSTTRDDEAILENASEIQDITLQHVAIEFSLDSDGTGSMTVPDWDDFTYTVDADTITFSNQLIGGGPVWELSENMLILTEHKGDSNDGTIRSWRRYSFIEK